MRRARGSARKCLERKPGAHHRTPGHPRVMPSQSDLLATLGGNRALLRELARLCLREDAPRLRAQLHAAAQAGDGAGIESAAHALKGLAGEFRAASAREAAAEIETAARAGRLDGIATRIAAFEREFEPLAAVLQSILDDQG